MTVASGCKSCIQAGQDVTLANNIACIAVAAPNEIGSQSTAPRITTNAVFGVRCRHFRNTHAMPLSKAIERPIANLPPEPRPVPADRYTPLSPFRLVKGKERQPAVYDSNDDTAKNLAQTGTQTISI